MPEVSARSPETASVADLATIRSDGIVEQWSIGMLDPTLHHSNAPIPHGHVDKVSCGCCQLVS